MPYAEWCTDKKGTIGNKCLSIAKDDLENKILFGFVSNYQTFLFRIVSNEF